MRLVAYNTKSAAIGVTSTVTPLDSVMVILVHGKWNNHKLFTAARINSGSNMVFFFCKLCMQSQVYVQEKVIMQLIAKEPYVLIATLHCIGSSSVHF